MQVTTTRADDGMMAGTTASCVFVRDSGQSFCLEDFPFDPRVIDQVKRDERHSYGGVPLTGAMKGSLARSRRRPPVSI